MLKGTQQINEQELQALAKDSQVFFEDLKKFLTEQVELLMTNAKAITKYLTGYLYKVALKNIEKTCLHLEQMQTKNDPKLAEKLVQYLSRAHEFVALRTRNATESATFIPVPFHTEFAQIHKQKLARIEALLERAQKLTPVSNTASKAWFSSFLYQANLLPNIWAAGYGLGNQSKDKASERLHKIYEELIALDQKKDGDVKNTNTTKTMLQIDAFTAEPGVESDYHKHVPPLKPIMTSFKQFMIASRETQAALTKSLVHEAIQTEYPNPTKRL